MNADELTEKPNANLTKFEVKAFMARRDKIVATLHTLIAEKGESSTGPSEKHCAVTIPTLE